MCSDSKGLGVECVPPNAAENTKLIEGFMQASLEANNPVGEVAGRGLHKTGFGAEVEMTIFEVDEDLRYGLLERPGKYRGVARMSMGEPARHGDVPRGVKGFAAQLLEVKGKKVIGTNIHNIVASNGEGFFAADEADLAHLMSLQPQGTTAVLLKHFLAGLRFRAMANFAQALMSQVTCVGEATFFSQMPVKFADGAMKYRFVPQHDQACGSVDRNSDHFLKSTLAAHCKGQGLRFDFEVQLQTSAYWMPIEDATSVWSQWRSPFRKVGELLFVPDQNIEVIDPPQGQPDKLMKQPDEEFQKYVENLSFNPFWCLEAHRPLGGIARVRRVIYELSAKFRHARNGIAETEPTYDDFLRAIKCLHR